MPSRVLLILLSIPFLFFTTIPAFAQDTTIKRKITTVKDTTILLDPDTSVLEINCREDFFKGNKIADPTRAMLLLKTRKIVSLNSFSKSLGLFPDHVLADLDQDGKKELILTGFTGGAHCCDEFYVFRHTGPDRFQYVFKTFAGNVCVNERNEFVFDFYERFGYFFTCYACTYIDTTDTAPIPVSYISLKYNKGKVLVVPGDKELKSRIRDNLAKLGEQPYEELKDDIAQDNGLRKAFALNLAVFHYSFGKNITATKKLFDQFYKYPDAKKVWAEFTRTMNWIKKENDF